MSVNDVRVLWVVAGLLASACGGASSAEPTRLVAVSFNTGTTEGLAHDAPPDDGYGAREAAWSDAHYGDGLAWRPAVEAAEAFFSTLRPDVVALQEIFDPAACPQVPLEARAGFVCETWTEGAPSVARRILGPDYAIACFPGKPDKCLAVRRAFARLEGCVGEDCSGALTGFPVEGCGRGARVARGRLQLEDGSRLSVVALHGSSGLKPEDVACRVAQLDQVFVELGDGRPGVDGTRNLVLGDLNTDPFRLAGGEASADRFRAHAGPGTAFTVHTWAGPDAPPSYGGLLDIDHVASDAFDGDCWTAGVDPGHPAVFEPVYFDHRPRVCSLVARGP